MDHLQNQTPPAPPPLPPGKPKGQYDFIFNPEQPTQHNLFGGNRRTQVLLLIAAVGVVAILIILLFAASFGRSDGTTSRLVAVARQQHELIRIADTGTQKARSEEAQNLAIITKLSLSSQQQDLLNIVSSQGENLSRQDLTASQSSTNDRTLEEAERNNRFDEVFIETLQSELSAYQQGLVEVYDYTNNQRVKDALASHYESASLLTNPEE